MGKVFLHASIHPKYIYISRKNDCPLQEACALVIDMCAGQL